jgi:hypothetical protein
VAGGVRRACRDVSGAGVRATAGPPPPQPAGTAASLNAEACSAYISA